MSSFAVIRQLEEKNVAQEVDKLLWSDQMDLIALSNFKGELSLHRITWTKAWTLAPPSDGVRVQALCWRPDGKILAVAYNNGTVLLLSVESKAVLHSINLDGESITCLSWSQEKKPKSNKKNAPDESNNYTEFVDCSAQYLPPLPCLSNFTSSNVKDEHFNNFFHKQTSMNILILGTEDGSIYMSIFGSINCAYLKLSQLIGTKCSILKVCLSDKLEKTHVVVKDAAGCIRIVSLNTEIFYKYSKELFCLELKKLQLNCAVTYLNDCVSTIKESWEQILIEIDSKLSSYASKVAPGTLSTDFYELMLFGMCAEEMQEFLLNDLTKKGLEKFGQIMEVSYTNIQKLLLKHVTHAGQNVTYHLAELRGMARLENRYKILGLDENKVTEAIGSSGSFLLKTGEMQQIINNSLIYFKAFFRWLYMVIHNLVQDTVPSEMTKLTEQDFKYVAEFIQSFDKIGSVEKDAADQSIMELLGQYLQNANLKIPCNLDHNEWHNFLTKFDCIKNNPTIFQHHKDLSLVQQLKHLEQSLVRIYDHSEECISKHIELLNCFQLDQMDLVCGTYTSQGTFLYALVDSSSEKDGVHLIELEWTPGGLVKARAAFLYFKQQNNLNFSVVDFKFYSESVLTLLLNDTEARESSLVQCSIGLLKDRLQVYCVDVGVFKERLVPLDATDCCQIKPIGMLASKFSVSGSRRVALVLSENKKKVMLFEMEGEEEEEDADMTNSTIRESDASMQENSDAE